MGKAKLPNLEGHVSGQANQPMSRPAHALTDAQVLEEIETSNELGDTGGVQPVKILIRQVANAMTLVMPLLERCSLEQIY